LARKKAPSPREMREWLEWRENGMSEVDIRDKTGRDLRTVRKSLVRAADERRLNLAKLDQVKNALKEHQGQLMDAVNYLVKNVTMPSSDLDIPWPIIHEYRIETPGVTLIWTKADGGTFRVENDLDDNQAVFLELLREHIPKDALWVRLEEFKNATLDYVASLVKFKDAAARLLMTRTGGIFVDSNLTPIEKAPGDKSAQIKLFDRNLLGLAYRRTLNRLLDNTSSDGIEERIMIEPTSGEVRLDPRGTLASCPGRETVCRESILSTLSDLLGKPEAKNVLLSYQRLSDAAKQLKNALQEIKLGLLITGECRICKRFTG